MKALLALVALAAVAPLQSQTAATTARPSVVRIEIDSTPGGMVAAGRATATITAQSGRYLSSLGKVDAKAVEELLAALDTPASNKPSLEECGGDEAWLAANYTRALAEYTHRKFTDFSSKQVSLFRTQFDLRHAQPYFEQLFKQWHTDDYPKLSVRVKAGDREYGMVRIAASVHAALARNRPTARRLQLQG